MTDAERTKYFDLITRNVHNLSRLVDDVLEVAEVDAGKFQLEIQPFDLRPPRRADGDGVERRTRARPARGRRSSRAPDRARRRGPEPPDTHQPGHRCAQIRTRRLARLDLRLRRGQCACRERQRSRVGIPAEDLPRLFERFSRLPNSRQANAKGTGLGLYICKQLVEAQGGRISVKSVPSMGSTFRYTVPHTA